MLKHPRTAGTEPMSARVLLGWLYDMSFTRLLAAQVIRVVYWLVTAFFSLVAVVALVRLFQDGGGALRIIVGIVVIAFAYVVYLVLARVLLEVLLVVFRMGDDLSALRTAGTPLAAQHDRSYGAGTSSATGPTTRGPAVPPALPVYLGPRIEETLGYEDPSSTAAPTPPPDPPAAGDPSADQPPPSPDVADTDRPDYPLEAEGPPWMT